MMLEVSMSSIDAFMPSKTGVTWAINLRYFSLRASFYNSITCWRHIACQHTNVETYTSSLLIWHRLKIILDQKIDQSSMIYLLKRSFPAQILIEMAFMVYVVGFNDALNNLYCLIICDFCKSNEVLCADDTIRKNIRLQWLLCKR